MGEIWALAIKDLKLLTREKTAVFFTFVFPIIYAVFFGVVFGGAGDGPVKGIKIGVVDEDQTPESKEFVALLAEGDDLRIEPLALNDAMDQVRRGKNVAYLRLKAGFGQKKSFFGGNDPAEIELGMDPVRKAEGGMLEGLVLSRAFRSLQDAFTDPDAADKAVAKALADIDKSDLSTAQRLIFHSFFDAFRKFVKDAPSRPSNGGSNAGGEFAPVRITKAEITRRKVGPLNAFEVSFPQSILWAIISATSGFAISLVIERTRGTLMRLQTAPLSRRQILLGKGLACFLTNTVVTSILLLLATLFFGVRVSSPALLAMAILCTAFGFVGIMSMLSTVGRSEQSAAGLGWAILMPLIMLGGGMVPLAFMPEWMQDVSVISPMRWAVEALEGAVWRDYSLNEMLLPCGVLLAVGVVGLFLGSRIFRWSDG